MPDRYFLDNVAGWILELDRGQGIPWKGNYTSWLEQKQERLRREEKSESERQKTLQRELEWIRMSPKARHAKGKARINAYESMLQQESEKRREDLEIHIPPGPRLGNIVIEAEGVSKGYGDHLLVEAMKFALPPGGIVGVMVQRRGQDDFVSRMITGQDSPTVAPLRLAKQCLWRMWTRVAHSTLRNRFGKKSQAVRIYLSWERARSTRVLTLDGSISPARISRRRLECCRVVNEIVCILRRC